MLLSINIALAAFACSTVNAADILFSGGTVIAFDRDSESLHVVRNGSVLVQDDRITGIFEAGAQPADLPADTERVEAAGKIITPGFIDTHRHGWQTAFKTLASNITLAEYFVKLSEFVAGDIYSPEDVYIGQLAGLYETLNAGVTTTLDHAHSTWSDETASAGLTASIDSGARVFYAYALHNVPKLVTVVDQIPNLEALLQNATFSGTPTSLGVAYDYWNVVPDTQLVVDLIQFVSWLDLANAPEELQALGILNGTAAIVFSHASFLTNAGAALLRQTNQYISITPESEMHCGIGGSVSHLIQDQAALGVDTHFTFSPDILTQARIWLQTVRSRLFGIVLDTWRIPKHNPMSVTQAFLLATRHGGLALRRDDLGVIAEGAKADLVVWDGEAPNMLGWVDPVAAVILHANVGNIEHVLVDGKWKKRDGKLTVKDYDQVKERFLASARRIQEVYRNQPPVDLGPNFNGGSPYAEPLTVDAQHGDGDGYGKLYL
ncbi:amidohydrolase family protein [Auriculariales sp. MPI-PUGE-AT-0066]|nr:amidohydrolase family protein [Auriculariales sp. MPI-PUGE-AT-0066]